MVWYSYLASKAHLIEVMITTTNRIKSPRNIGQSVDRWVSGAPHTQRPGQSKLNSRLTSYAAWTISSANVRHQNTPFMRHSPADSPIEHHRKDDNLWSHYSTMKSHFVLTVWITRKPKLQGRESGAHESARRRIHHDNSQQKSGEYVRCRRFKSKATSTIAKWGKNTASHS